MTNAPAAADTFDGDGQRAPSGTATARTWDKVEKV